MKNELIVPVLHFPPFWNEVNKKIIILKYLPRRHTDIHRILIRILLERNITMNIKISLMSMISFLLIACSSQSNYPAKGDIIITYQLNQVEGLEPSYQTVIWLEDLNGKYINSFLVSEYLSYGGYNDSTICPDWSDLADWDNVSDENFDAVTTATPSVGKNQLKINCQKDSLFVGKYRYHIQTHIIEQYNILYHGEIEIGSISDENIATQEFIPVKHPLAANVLNNVKAVYKP